LKKKKKGESERAVKEKRNRLNGVWEGDEEGGDMRGDFFKWEMLKDETIIPSFRRTSAENCGSQRGRSIEGERRTRGEGRALG